MVRVALCGVTLTPWDRHSPQKEWPVNKELDKASTSKHLSTPVNTCPDLGLHYSAPSR